MYRKLIILTLCCGVFLTGSAISAQASKSSKSSKKRYDYVTAGLLCIHRYEGAWNANTGNGYYGGLQMDLGFQSTYGKEFLRRWGTANHWPVWAQLLAGRRAYYGYAGYRARYFGPWPNTRKDCGI